MNEPETSEAGWKPPQNICCCCLTGGCYKNVSSEYYFSGEKEIYNEMLRETFDIQITSHDASNRLICEDCITRLRDAKSFKETVLQSTNTLIKHFNSLKEDVKPDDLKTESIKVEPVQELDDCHADEPIHDDSMDDDEILANIKLELAGMSEDSRPVKKGRITKNKNDIRKKIKSEKVTDKKSEKNWLKIAERRGNGPLLRENSLKLIANSTICVFQWNQSWYRCFCCKEPFSDMSILREHTEKSHTLDDIEKKIISQQNRLVKVEVSVLFCKICQVAIENLSTLRNHLCTHGVIFNSDEDLLVPFKINSKLQCQICEESFTVFRLLNIHMNKHFQKQVCHICGAAFSNLVFLNLHKTRSHKPFNCKHCNEVFVNRIDKKQHEINFHGVKYERKLRFPCPYCSDRFFQENFRVQHLVEKHGLQKPEYKCLVCSKDFITKSLCNNHMKNVHMKEKNQECDICHHLFYTKSDVARHRVTHTGEKRFSCNLCNNPFATKDSLRRHMKRTHVLH